MTLYGILANPKSEHVLRWAWRIGAVAVACGLAAQIFLLVGSHSRASAAILNTKNLETQEAALKLENKVITSQLSDTVYLDDKLDSDQYLASIVYQLGEAATDALVNLVTVQAEQGSSSSAPIPSVGDAKDDSAAGQTPPEGPTWETIPLKIEVTGTFSQVMEFLDRLCELPRPVEATAVDLTVSSIDTSADRVTVQMRASLTLHRMETKPAAAKDTTSGTERASR